MSVASGEGTKPGTAGVQVQGRSTTGQLSRLTSLRAFAALAVFVCHLQKWGVAALPLRASEVGYVGVTFFFVLSGFVLGWGTRPGLPALTFYRRRIARIWPAHLVVLAVLLVLPVTVGVVDWRTAIPSALLVQAWAIDPAIGYGMNGVAWSLSCEVFFYACFPLAVAVARRMPLARLWALVAVAFVLQVVATALNAGAAYRLPVLRFPEFLLGLAVAVSFRAGWRPRVPVPLALGLVALALAACVPMPPLTAGVVVAVPFALAIAAAADRDLDGTPGWLTHRWLVFAGEASFAFYLVHELVIINLRPHLTHSYELGVPVIAVVAAAAAVLLHVAVERPANRLLRGGGRSTALATPS